MLIKGVTKHLGTFRTALEAAVCVAKALNEAGAEEEAESSEDEDDDEDDEDRPRPQLRVENGVQLCSIMPGCILKRKHAGICMFPPANGPRRSEARASTALRQPPASAPQRTQPGSAASSSSRRPDSAPVPKKQRTAQPAASQPLQSASSAPPPAPATSSVHSSAVAPEVSSAAGSSAAAAASSTAAGGGLSTGGDGEDITAFLARIGHEQSANALLDEDIMKVGTLRKILQRAGAEADDKLKKLGLKLGARTDVLAELGMES